MYVCGALPLRACVGQGGWGRTPAALACSPPRPRAGSWARIGDSCEARGCDPIPILSLAVLDRPPSVRYCGLRALPRGRSTDGMYARGGAQSSPQNTTSSGISSHATTISRLLEDSGSRSGGRPVAQPRPTCGCPVEVTVHPSTPPSSGRSRGVRHRREEWLSARLFYCVTDRRGTPYQPKGPAQIP